jgi:hypothetical protein
MGSEGSWMGYFALHTSKPVQRNTASLKPQDPRACNHSKVHLLQRLHHVWTWKVSHRLTCSGVPRWWSYLGSWGLAGGSGSLEAWMWSVPFLCFLLQWGEGPLPHTSTAMMLSGQRNYGLNPLKLRARIHLSFFRMFFYAFWSQLCKSNQYSFLSEKVKQ